MSTEPLSTEPLIDHVDLTLRAEVMCRTGIQTIAHVVMRADNGQYWTLMVGDPMPGTTPALDNVVRKFAARWTVLMQPDLSDEAEMAHWQPELMEKPMSYWKNQPVDPNIIQNVPGLASKRDPVGPPILAVLSIIVITVAIVLSVTGVLNGH